MIAILAYVNATFIRGGVSFTFEGASEYHPISGKGRARLAKDGRLTGRIKIHDGDETTFAAERTSEPPIAIPSPPSHRDKWRR